MLWSRMPYTIINHTADLGMIVRAPDLSTLFAEAARAMIDVMGAKAERSACEILLAVEGYDREDLLIRWLNEVLYLISDKHFRIAGIDITVLEDTRMEARLTGETRPTRLECGIKAVTYHALAITQALNHLETTIIFDT